MGELANSSCATATLEVVLTRLALEVGWQLVLGMGEKANSYARTAATHKCGAKLGLVTSRPQLSQIMGEDTGCTLVALPFCEAQAQLVLLQVWW